MIPRRDIARGLPAPRNPRTADILRPTFRRFLWNAFDHLGLLVVANLIWLALCLPVLTAPASTAALFHLGRKVAASEEVSLQDFFTGFRIHFVPSLKAGAFALTALAVVWLNVDFYSHLGGRATLPGMLLAAVMVWAGAFVAVMHVHLLPLIVYGERSLRVALRKSALLVLDNPGFSIGLAVQALSVALLCVITGAGLVFGLGSFLAVLLTTGHRELLKKYFPDSSEASEPQETRVLRDLVRPWESGRRR
jgi:uncharacterized membrane protein YesL